MDIRKILEQGQAVQDAEHAAASALKVGNLRGGTAGCVADDGQIYGECHRVALARLLEVEKPHEPNRSIMFDAGNAAEDVWAAKLRAAGLEIAREDEYPVVWTVPGTKRLVTGRPDILIGKTELYRAGNNIVQAKFVPEFGLELKGIYSASSAIRVHVDGIPDPKHLSQAGFYSMALGNLPYALCYTNPSVIDVPGWAIKRVKAKKIQPFYRMFYLRWTDDGRLQYRDERDFDILQECVMGNNATSAGWKDTTITRQGISDFYSLVHEMEEKKELGPRPANAYADGTQLPYDRCNYCSFQKACDQQEDNFDAWLDQAKKDCK
jgi:hypothetical protein